MSLTETGLKRREGGNSIIEFCFLTPWLIFLFVGAYDWGFYSYSLIATQAASRIGVMYASSSSSTLTDTTKVCKYALEQLKNMPNVGSGAMTCANGSAVSSANPVGVSVSSVSGPDGSVAAQVSITYQTPLLIPMLTGLPGQVTITRTAEMRLQS